MLISNLLDHPQSMPVVAGWLYGEFIDGIRPGVSLEMIMEKLRSMQRSAVPLTLVAIEAERCLGTVSLFENDLRQRPDLTPWLAALYVAPPYQNRGLGSLLTDHVLTLATDLGYEHCYLRTEDAAGYYRKTGWQSLGKTIDTEFSLATEVFMKSLTRDSG